MLQNRSLFQGYLASAPRPPWWTFSAMEGSKNSDISIPGLGKSRNLSAHPSMALGYSEVFGRIAPKYLRGTAPVAMSLTGGLDSRMILAWAGAAPGACHATLSAGLIAIVPMSALPDARGDLPASHTPRFRFRLTSSSVFLRSRRKRSTPPTVRWTYLARSNCMSINTRGRLRPSG